MEILKILEVVETNVEKLSIVIPDSWIEILDWSENRALIIAPVPSKLSFLTIMPINQWEKKIESKLNMRLDKNAMFFRWMIGWCETTSILNNNLLNIPNSLMECVRIEDMQTTLLILHSDRIDIVSKGEFLKVCPALDKDCSYNDIVENMALIYQGCIFHKLLTEGRVQ